MRQNLVSLCSAIGIMEKWNIGVVGLIRVACYGMRTMVDK